MSDDTLAFALNNALTEIRNVCPEVQSSFVIDKDATVVAADAETSEAKTEKVAKSLQGILEKADTIGGLDSIMVEGSKGNVHIIRVENMYLTTVASKKAEVKYVETVARVLIPTVLKLLDNLASTPLTRLSTKKPASPSPLWKPEPEDEEEESAEEINEEESAEEINEEESAKVEEEIVPELELPSNQLIVESFSGLLVRGDTVQISEDIVSQWEEHLDGKEVNLVEIEAFNGQAKQCKVKTLNGSKLENKAVIRIPEKVCDSLDIRKGELVRVKPIVT